MKLELLATKKTLTVINFETSNLKIINRILDMPSLYVLFRQISAMNHITDLKTGGHLNSLICARLSTILLQGQIATYEIRLDTRRTIKIYSRKNFIGKDLTTDILSYILILYTPAGKEPIENRRSFRIKCSYKIS